MANTVSSATNPWSSISSTAFTACAMSSGRSLLGLSFCAKPAAAPKLVITSRWGSHQKDADVVLAELLPPAFGHAAQRRLAGVVGRAVRRAPVRRGRPDIHDVPAIAGNEMLGRLARHLYGSGDVGGEGALEVRRVRTSTSFLKVPKPALLTRMSRESPNFSSKISRYGALDVGFLEIHRPGWDARPTLWRPYRAWPYRAR